MMSSSSLAILQPQFDHLLTVALEPYGRARTKPLLTILQTQELRDLMDVSSNAPCEKNREEQDSVSHPIDTVSSMLSVSPGLKHLALIRTGEDKTGSSPNNKTA